MFPAAVWIISGLRSRRKHVTAPAPELFFHKHDSSSGALFFHDSGSSSGFYSFSHINTLIVLVHLKLNGKLMKSSRPTQNQENMPNILSNLIR